MEIISSLSIKLESFVELKTKVVELGGDNKIMISVMEDVTRNAVAGLSFKDRYTKEWGLRKVPQYNDQQNFSEELNNWAHAWHNLINDCIVLNDATTCQYLEQIVVGGLF